MKQSTVLQMIVDERNRQDAKWGTECSHGRGKWLAILGEEFGEIAKAINEHNDLELFDEIVQVAAVCVKWLEMGDFSGQSEAETL